MFARRTQAGVLAVLAALCVAPLTSAAFTDKINIIYRPLEAAGVGSAPTQPINQDGLLTKAGAAIQVRVSPSALLCTRTAAIQGWPARCRRRRGARSEACPSSLCWMLPTGDPNVAQSSCLLLSLPFPALSPPRPRLHRA